MLRLTVGCLLLALGIYVAAFHVGPLHELDARVLERATRLADAPVAPIADAAVLLIEPLLYVPICAGIVLVALRAGGLAHALAAAVVIAGANLSTQLLKRALAEPRPHDLPIEQVHPVSWPSGHATAAFVALLALLLVTPAPARRTVAAAGGIVAIAVAAGVVIHNWHYPSDALGGAAVAGAWASAAAAWLSSRRPAPAATAARRRRWLRATG